MQGCTSLCQQVTVIVTVITMVIVIDGDSDSEDKHQFAKREMINLMVASRTVGGVLGLHGVLVLRGKFVVLIIFHFLSM